MTDRKTGYSSLNTENNRGVNNDVMFAYVHTKINILLSVLITSLREERANLSAFRTFVRFVLV